MLSSYPELFAAAMPVAGNPSRCDVESVAQTPVYTVMGTADRIMSINPVREFTYQLGNADGSYQFDEVEGWSHEETCIMSYTNERLKWLFGHVRNTP